MLIYPRLIAILLGRLNLCADCAVNAYLDLAEFIFAHPKAFHWLGIRDGTFESSRLKTAIQQQIGQALKEKSIHASMMDLNNTTPACKA